MGLHASVMLDGEDPLAAQKCAKAIAATPTANVQRLHPAAAAQNGPEKSVRILAVPVVATAQIEAHVIMEHATAALNSLGPAVKMSFV